MDRRNRITGRFMFAKPFGLVFNDKDPRCVSKAKQCFAKESDINEIIRKARKTGLLPRVVGAKFGDFSNGEDFFGWRLKMLQAERDFQSLSAKVRDRFGNNVGDLLDFLADPKNNVEAVELGLKDKSVLPVKVTDGTVVKEVLEPAKSNEPQA